MGSEAVDWPDDSTTYKHVCEALFRDGLVDDDEVEVEVENGIVTLSGVVPNRTARLKAVESIVNVFGVINIINKLTVKPDHGLVGRSDGWPV